MITARRPVDFTVDDRVGSNHALYPRNQSSRLRCGNLPGDLYDSLNGSEARNPVDTTAKAVVKSLTATATTGAFTGSFAIGSPVNNNLGHGSYVKDVIATTNQTS